MEGLRNLFQSIDKDGSGFISVDEMRKSLKQKGANVGQSEVRHPEVPCIVIYKGPSPLMPLVSGQASPLSQHALTAS